jgi:diguanylate cyclase (GGDEF)-like protein
LAARPNARQLDAAREALAPLSAAEDLWSCRGRETLAQLRRELAATRQELDEVLKRDALLERQAELLERALSTARKFVYRDELTGLPNRRLLLDHYQHAAARAARQGRQVAVLFLDLDGFKHINDTLGHGCGDELLQQVAARLSACVRASDTASRLGGDEFVVLLPDLDSPQCAASAAANIRARLAMPYRLDGRAVGMTVSIGTAIHPTDGDDLGELLKLADRAMYRDKVRSRAPATVASPVEREAVA